MPPGGSTKYGPQAQTRNLLPAAYQGERFALAEPAVPPTVPCATQDLWPLSLAGLGQPPLGAPLFPGLVDGTRAQGDVQQGFLKDSAGQMPSFVPVQLSCAGDEFILAVTADGGAGSPPVWDFDGAHFAISWLFGRCGYKTGQPTIATPLVPMPECGVYASPGVGP